jgi:hypothetical protein
MLGRGGLIRAHRCEDSHARCHAVE